MSLVSTYVESQEGHWYRDPAVRGPGWFICWDDDEPIELVIEVAKNIKAETILQNLAKRGWKLSIIGKGHEGAQRMFGKDIRSGFRPALSYFLRQKNGPTDAMLKGNARMEAKPQGQGVYYTNSKNGNGGRA